MTTLDHTHAHAELLVDPPVLDVDYTAYPWSLKEIYPAVRDVDYSAYPWSLLEIYPAVKVTSQVQVVTLSTVEVRLRTQYPTFDICKRLP